MEMMNYRGFEGCEHRSWYKLVSSDLGIHITTIFKSYKEWIQKGRMEMENQNHWRKKLNISP